jgi:hypothetical protein
VSGFEADIDRLSARAKDFDPLVARAARISAELEQALDGTPWGDDIVGQSFAAAHVKPAEEAAARLRGLGSDLAGAGGSFAEAAQRYQAGDAGAADSIKEL